MFELKSDYKPNWDQPKAIKNILDNFNSWKKILTLLWATWTWKTFTMANVINSLQKPTLIVSHNKTLAAQLATEFKHFFPNNAVHYFVSYFDYYQPESYLPEKWVYIEKEATINQEIKMYRLSTLSSLLSRKDVIVVASVSSLYWLWKKDFFKQNSFIFEVWKKYSFEEIKKKLIKIQYKPVSSSIDHWMFDFQWDRLDIYSSTEKNIYRLYFNDELLEYIEVKDLFSFKSLWKKEKIVIWPATQFLQDTENVDRILEKILKEMEDVEKKFRSEWKLLEAERIKKRVLYDIRMIKETWFVNWIENYSRYFDKRNPWEPQNTLFDYFPDDFLFIIDESHITIPQFQAMPKADKSRKISLINFGFRLPSAIDHRPLWFDEMEVLLWLKVDKKYKYINKKLKKKSKTLFTSATPSDYEKNISDDIIEQIIRPTWLIDPLTYIYPKDWNDNNLINSIESLINKKNYLKDLLNWYKLK